MYPQVVEEYKRLGQLGGDPKDVKFASALRKRPSVGALKCNAASRFIRGPIGRLPLCLLHFVLVHGDTMCAKMKR